MDVEERKECKMTEANFEKVGFLVRDESLAVADSDFIQWMHKEGYRNAYFKGCYGCPWVFVSITCKTYAYGMPGIKIVQPVGNHAITIDEFKMIFEIYKKYEGLDPLVFKSADEPQKGD